MEVLLRYVTAALMQILHIIGGNNIEVRKFQNVLPFSMDLVIAVGEPKEMKHREEDEFDSECDDDNQPIADDEKGAFYLNIIHS